MLKMGMVGATLTKVMYLVAHMHGPDYERQVSTCLLLGLKVKSK